MWRIQDLESRDLSSNLNFAAYRPASFEVNNSPFPGEMEDLGKETMPEAPMLPPLGQQPFPIQLSLSTYQYDWLRLFNYLIYTN